MSSLYNIEIPHFHIYITLKSHNSMLFYRQLKEYAQNVWYVRIHYRKGSVMTIKDLKEVIPDDLYVYIRNGIVVYDEGYVENIDSSNYWGYKVSSIMPGDGFVDLVIYISR